MSTIPPKPSRTTTNDRALRAVEHGADKLEETEDEPELFGGDRYKPLTRDDVDDLSLVPQHVRLIAGEVRDLVEVVRGSVVPALKRIEEWQRAHEQYTARELRRLHARLDKLEGKA